MTDTTPNWIAEADKWNEERGDGALVATPDNFEAGYEAGYEAGRDGRYDMDRADCTPGWAEGYLKGIDITF